MNRGAKAALLLLLLAGTAASVLVLAGGREAECAPFLSAAGARTGFRALTLAVGLGAWFLSQSLLGARAAPEGRIGDAVHDWTAGWHARLVANPSAANVLLAVSSAFIDLFGLFLLGSTLFGPTLRPGLGLLLVFAFRQFSQWTCALPPPPGMIWRSPGVPTLLVTYGVANDFFFSGHTAIAVLGAIEVARVAPWWAAAVAGAVALFEATAVLVLRAHYTMDVLAGAVAAAAAAALAARLCTGF